MPGNRKGPIFDETDTGVLDLGHGHRAKFFSWSSNRELNPQHADVPDIPRAGLMVEHRAHDAPDEWCGSGIHFDLPDVRRLWPNEAARWQVESWEPLTLSPSLLCRSCGDHGFIRNGKWEPC